MQLIEVNVICAQAFQRGFALFDNVATVVAGGQDVVFVHAAVDFGRQHDAMALAVALQRLADDGLSLPPRE